MRSSKLQELANMDWGSFTPEFSKEEEFVYVYNHLIEDAASVGRTLSFIIGKIEWCGAYLKTNIQSVVVIDDVGQAVNDAIRSYMRERLAAYASKVHFMSKEKGYGV